jgi:hypothetical protein
MADVTYHISASSIGGAFIPEDRFVLYSGSCGVPQKIITEVTQQELTDGFSITVDETTEKIYLIPVLSNPGSSDCILGCVNEWSEHTLSNFIAPTPTPSVTPSNTPSSTPAATPSVTPSITPSQTPGTYYTTFGDHIVEKVQIDRLQITVPGGGAGGSVGYGIASNIASYAAGGDVVQISNSSEGDFNKIANLDRSFRIYTEGLDQLIVTVSQDGDSKVWWYEDPDPQVTEYYVIFDNITLPQAITAPNTTTNLNYQEI